MPREHLSYICDAFILFSQLSFAAGSRGRSFGILKMCIKLQANGFMWGNVNMPLFENTTALFMQNRMLQKTHWVDDQGWFMNIKITG